MRSTLTNSPVASFTTQLLRVTQHATGLMVKVALLLPSRGQLSSQRQLRWTHTGGLALLGHDLVTSTSATWHLLFGLDKHRWTFVLILYISNASASVPGGRFPNPQQRQALSGCTQPYLKIPFTYKRQDIQGENPNSPPHIAAHLQGTQNPPHRSQPCKRAAIANTRQTVF